MASTMVKAPDGTEQDGSALLCEDCEQPLSNHRCNGGSSSTGSASAGAGTATRSTGPRKAPQARPPCPHCNGAIHFSMPGGLQNMECAMRQYYLDQGTIADPYERLPVYGLDEVGRMLDWSKSLKTPLTYGRMESAAGGAGTYAAQRPPSEKRAKKQKPAAAGEKIEDMAEAVDPTASATGTVTTEKRKRGRPKKQAPAAVAAQAPAPAPAPTPARAPEPALDFAAVARRQAERRAMIQGTRAR